MRLLSCVAASMLCVVACGGSSSSDAAQGTSGASGTSGSGGGSAGSTSGSGGGAGTGGSTAGTGGAAGTGGSATLHSCDAPSPGPIALKGTILIENGLTAPVFATHAPKDPDRLYVLQQGGRVRIVEKGVLQPGQLVDLAPVLVSGGERGLLGLAFHPGFPEVPRLFVHFSARATAFPGTGLADGDTVVAELAATPTSADLSTLSVVLTQKQPDVNHNGGALEFSPKDGMLYLGLGDGGSAGDPWGPIGNGQNLDTFLGKILRIDVSKKPYAVPADNPKLSATKPEIWDYGLRNPYRFAFDPCGGALYVADVGQDAIEEIDVEPPGKGGRNYGWKIVEGTACYGSPTCAKDGLTAPVHTYTHADAACAVIGGFVYRGSAVPALRGRYLFADYCNGKVWSLRWDEATGQAADVLEHTTDLGTEGYKISGFGQDARGEVYITYYGGLLLRIDPSG